MNAKENVRKTAGFLSRLRKDQSGNVIAMLAAGIVPAIGILGGSVDMSRIYLARTTLQAACDAGALMGRRTMGTSTWDANDEIADERANDMFEANFADGAFGTTNLTKSFSESGGTVTGTASVQVPMTLMRVFGVQTNTVNVSCTAEMRIPASDIMFVLDTTGSMNCPDDGSSCPNGNNNGVEASNSKMKGLRTASACFYEALAKKNITDVNKTECGEEENPVGATTDVRLRFGFVPYSVNANVGKLLPHEYIADTWTYQSRERIMEPQTDPNAWDRSDGVEGPYVPTNSQNTPSANTAWADLTSNYSYNGNSYSFNYERGSSAAACVAAPPTHAAPSNVGAYVFVGQTPTTVTPPPTNPTTAIVKTWYRDTATSNYNFQYVAYSQTTGSGSKAKTKYYCKLQRRSVDRNTNRTTFTRTTPISWTYAPVFLRWAYKPTTFNVKALENSDPEVKWNSSLSLPIGNSGTNRTVTWNGCVEERQTARIMDNDPSDNWSPTIPTTALDMDIELTPDATKPETLWGPLLGGAVYTRHAWTGYGWDNTNGTFETTSNSTYTSLSYNGNNYYSGQVNEYCPSEAKLYSTMEPADFWKYLDELETGGNTYHDSGLLWGARLMAPEGIFKSVTSDTDTWVERHMVFMTDGDTTANPTDYSSHGVHWWDRRQNDGTSGPSDTWIEANIDARTQALCKWVRDENITLWVVAFGQGISAATKTNLQNCATSGRYFEASNTAGLITKFKEIANTISALRLTQ